MLPPPRRDGAAGCAEPPGPARARAAGWVERDWSLSRCAAFDDILFNMAAGLAGKRLSDEGRCAIGLCVAGRTAHGWLDAA